MSKYQIESTADDETLAVAAAMPADVLRAMDDEDLGLDLIGRCVDDEHRNRPGGVRSPERIAAQIARGFRAGERMAARIMSHG